MQAPTLWRDLSSSHCSGENHSPAFCEGVSIVPAWKVTHWLMTDHITLSIWSTCTRALIYTFLLNTCLVAGAFCIDATLWSTVGRNPNVTRQGAILIDTSHSASKKLKLAKSPIFQPSEVNWQRARYFSQMKSTGKEPDISAK